MLPVELADATSVCGLFTTRLAPAVGAVRETLGAVGSVPVAVTVTEFEIWLPVESVAIAMIV